MNYATHSAGAAVSPPRWNRCRVSAIPVFHDSVRQIPRPACETHILLRTIFRALMSDFRYRPEVDGLRAIAVGMVLLFHADLGFSGGYVGVDIFFVISGFLITGLILKEQQRGEFGLANFWLRRIRRIIPASAVVVAAVLVAGYGLLLPTDYAELGRSVIAQQCLLANVFFWRNTGYFDGAAELKPLLHTWSLAVEEQFYLGYPFLLMLLNRFARPKAVAMLTLIGVVSLTASEYGVDHHRSATFYLLPTRAWELVIGGLVAFAPPPARLTGRGLQLLNFASLAGIVLPALLYQANTRFPGLSALVPCGATAAFIYANSERLGAPAKVLASKPVVFVGLISYSLYLWHWPVLAFVRYRLGDRIAAPVACAALAVATLLAWISWRFVETPFRTRRILPRSQGLLAVAGGSLAALVMAGTGVAVDGIRGRYSESFLAIVSVPYAGTTFGATGSLEQGWTFPQIGDRAAFDSKRPTFLLWGDSYAKCVSSLCNDIAASHHVWGYDAGRGGTPPLLDAWTGTEGPEAVAFNDFAISFAERNQIPWLILIAGWDIHASGMSKLTDHQGGAPSTVFQRSFERMLQRAENKGIHVAVVLQIPYQRDNVPSRVAREALAGHSGETYGIDRSEHERFCHKAKEHFHSLGNRITVIDPSDACFARSGLSVIGRNGTPYYSDAGHPSREGVIQFYDAALKQLFAAIVSD